jgi:hypothetical protein
VGIYIASLVVHVRQAEEDVLIIGLFWTIAGEDKLVIARSLLNFLVGQEFGPSWGTDSGPLPGARIGGLRASCPKVRFGH